MKRFLIILCVILLCVGMVYARGDYYKGAGTVASSCAGGDALGHDNYLTAFNLAADYSYIFKVTFTDCGDLDKAYFQHIGTSNSTARVVVYTDVAGTPTTLVASVEIANYATDDTGQAYANWASGTFASGSITAGDYWIGAHCSADRWNTFRDGTSSGYLEYNADTYADGTETTWVQDGTAAYELNLIVTTKAQ